MSAEETDELYETPLMRRRKEEVVKICLIRTRTKKLTVYQ